MGTRGIPFFGFPAEIPSETSAFPFHLFHLQSLFLCHFPKLLPRILRLFSSFFKGDRGLPGPPLRTRVTWNSGRPTVGRGVHKGPVKFTGGEGCGRESRNIHCSGQVLPEPLWEVSLDRMYYVLKVKGA